VGSDRARVSFDRSRHWRSVISQQGRVTVEADVNEEAAIAAAESRVELIDLVGPSGTPDDGYRVIPVIDSQGSATGDLTIQHGTMYVGGERMSLEPDLDYADQPDWVDRTGDPLWVAPAVPKGDATEAVYLLLREQEVGAVEDPALLDVALGGPDTAARRRILQRVVRAHTQATDCSGALAGLEQAWAQQGLQFDESTMQLESAAALQVSFEQPPGVASPCSPVAQGGYLGAENQLIRVQVASVDAKGVPTLVWGYDNAFFLYRVQVTSTDQAGDTTTLTLASAPVDSYHQPQQGQAVEVLEAAAQITSPDFIAAHSGIVTSLTDSYAPDTQQVVIGTALGAPTTDSPQLFMRVWQDKVAYRGPDPVALGDTGVQVTLSSSSGIYHVGDFWTFAVRPGTPTTVSPVYPQRILDAPQPPNGPGMWACELALVSWADGVPTVTDCRRQFANLVTLTEDSGGCCTVVVGPGDVGGGAGLQSLIDTLARQGPATICLRPGTYTLPQPLRIGKGSIITIEVCGGGAKLQGPADASKLFVLGLVFAEGASALTLRGLELALPSVEFPLTEAAIAGVPKERQGLVAAYGKELAVSIGLYLLGAADLLVEDCTFTFPGDGGQNRFAAGILAARAVDGLRVMDCDFKLAEATSVPFGELAIGAQADPPYAVSFGYVQLPTNEPSSDTATTAPSLQDASLQSNLFDGITVPVLVVGEVGTTRLEDNTVRSCYGGFWVLAAADVTAMIALLDRLEAGNAEVWKLLESLGLTALADPVLLFATVVGRVIPTQWPTSKIPIEVGTVALPTAASLAGAAKLLDGIYALDRVAGAAVAGAATKPAAAAAKAPAAKAPRTTRARASRKATPALIKALPPEIQQIFTDPQLLDLADQIPAADVGLGLYPRIDVRSNQLDAVIADAYSASGLLLVVDGAGGGETSLVCTDNRIRARVPAGAAVSVQQVSECTFTGNLVGNELAPVKQVIFDQEAGPNRSLVLRPLIPDPGATKAPPTPLVAVTGNVLVGSAILPARPLAPPLNVWDGLNTIAQYLPPAGS
jgi:hypothetical protein